MPVLQDILYKVSLRSVSGSTATDSEQYPHRLKERGEGRLLYCHSWNGNRRA